MSDLQHIHLTDRFMFTTSPGPYSTVRFSVLSNIVAGTSANPLYLYKQDSLMQEFKFAAGETVLQIMRAFPISRMMMNKTAASKGVATDTVQLEGCIVVTNRAIYELRQHVPAEVKNSIAEKKNIFILVVAIKIIFFGLLSQSKDKNQAEMLGKTVGLDMFQLYESAGDQVKKKTISNRYKLF